MNNVLAWAKKNWLIVVLVAIAIISVPVLLYVSAGMNRSLVESVQKDVQADFNEVNNDRVTYTLPTPVPGAPKLEHPATPNAVVTQWFVGRQAQIAEKAGQAWETALRFNQNSHKPLVDGLFPEPEQFERQSKPVAFLRAYTTEFPEQLLAVVNAGMPPEPAQLAASMQESYERRRQQLLNAGGQAELTPEQKTTLDEEMRQIRLSRYRTRAAEIGVYADRAIFADIPPAPTGEPAPPLLRDAWEWQTAAWFMTDLMEAVAAANEAASAQAGEPGVPGAVVKRITRIDIAPLPVGAEASNNRQRDPFGNEMDTATPASAEITGLMPTDPRVSITGRRNGSDNQLYDVRTATVEAIVDARRFPQFLDALTSTNFFTVLEADVQRIDPWEHIAQGYYYGDAPVVRVTLGIESVWFRDWTRPLMPPAVKTALNVAEPAPAGDATGAGGPG